MADVSCYSICSIASYFDPEKYGDDLERVSTGHIWCHQNMSLTQRL